ncbi:hypothetical protein [Pseudomonas sp. NPDC088444]|uniref:hypothetical protein n=1 Tax=Pseudomonas sp. NPDC088444 TaxID=3364456 RepID=UPI00384F335B
MTADRALELAIVFTSLVFFVHALTLFWVALFRLEQIEQALENSKFCRDTKRQWENAGLIGLQYRLAMASSAIIFVKLYAKRGLVDPEEVRRMPKSLKRWATIPLVNGSVLMLVLFVLLVLAGEIDLSL